MHPQIKEQQRLMKQALKLLDEIDTVKSLIEPLDPIITKVLTADLLNQYKETTANLFQNFLITANVA